MLSHPRWPLALTLGYGLIACKVDSGTSQYCERTTTITGDVAGTAVGSDKFSVQAAWFNKSLEEYSLSSVDQQMMDRLGLDKNSQEDVDRYKYWVAAYDLRLIQIEELTTTPLGSLGAKFGKDFSVFLFDLARHAVQPGTAVNVFDLTDLTDARDGGDTKVLGDSIRDLVDEMRDNGTPDAIVGFAPDRSEEAQPEASLINLFSPNTRFGMRGQVRFSGLLDGNGDEVATLSYPVANIDATTVDVTATFADGSVTANATCVGTIISD